MANLKRLTLTIDEEVIRRAKRYSRERGLSISRLVGSYLAGLEEQEAHATVSRTVRRLQGILPTGSNSAEEHKAHLEKKYTR